MNKKEKLYVFLDVISRKRGTNNTVISNTYPKSKRLPQSCLLRKNNTRMFRIRKTPFIVTKVKIYSKKVVQRANPVCRLIHEARGTKINSILQYLTLKFIIINDPK